jgi:hypothetical protein
MPSKHLALLELVVTRSPHGGVADYQMGSELGDFSRGPDSSCFRIDDILAQLTNALTPRVKLGRFKVAAEGRGTRDRVVVAEKMLRLFSWIPADD